MRHVEAWFVLEMSKKFAEILEDMPEAILSPYVEIDGGRIPGAKQIFRADSQQEVESNLLRLAEEMEDKENTVLFVVQKKGDCYDCRTKEDFAKPCPHIISLSSMPASSRQLKIDIKQLVAAKRQRPE